MIIVTEPRHKGYSTKTTQRHCGQVERPTSNEKDEELATDPHRLTQTFVRATCSDKNSHRFAKEKAEGRSDSYTETDRSEELERLFGSLTVDISKIHRELNWYPSFTMEEGIRETVFWYKSADPPAIAYNNSVSDR